VILPTSRLSHRVSFLACALAFFATPTFAQSADTVDVGFGSLRAPSSNHAIGLALGRSDYGLRCGLLPGCEDGDRSVRLYGRTMPSEYWGAEVGVLDLGRVDLGGGSSRAQGVNLSVIGRMPLTESLSAYGKLGTTYGYTSNAAIAGSGLRSGSDNGFGLSYGAGVSWQFSPRISAVLEWDSHDFKFAGGRDPVRSTSLGLQFRY
jgi:OOP family OmpA-OmpF porin